MLLVFTRYHVMHECYNSKLLIHIASNRRTRRKVSVYVQYIFRLNCYRKCMDAIERLVFTAAAAVIVDTAIASNFS